MLMDILQKWPCFVIRVHCGVCPCIIDANETQSMGNCDDHASSRHTHVVDVLYSVKLNGHTGRHPQKVNSQGIVVFKWINQLDRVTSNTTGKHSTIK